MNDKNYDINDEMRTPSGTEFDPIVANGIRRRYGFTIQGNRLTAETPYTIGGMRYKVNSIFDMSNSPESEEALKRLMVQEIDKVS